jgi:hypothetical protein
MGVDTQCGGDADGVDRAPGEQFGLLKAESVGGRLQAEAGDSDDASLVVLADQAGLVESFQQLGDDDRAETGELREFRSRQPVMSADRVEGCPSQKAGLGVQLGEGSR